MPIHHTSLWTAVAAAMLVSPVALSADNGKRAVDPDWDAHRTLTVEEAIDLSMQSDARIELVHLLSQMYAASGDQDIIAALRRLERESSDPATRAAAATAQLTSVELPDEVSPITRGGGIDELPGDVDAVMVECNGECSDNVLGDFCQAAHTDTTTAIAVSCQNVQEQNQRQCGGAGDNRCGSVSFNNSTTLSSLCDDIDGFDAIVYCANP